MYLYIFDFCVYDLELDLIMLKLVCLIEAELILNINQL